MAKSVEDDLTRLLANVELPAAADASTVIRERRSVFCLQYLTSRVAQLALPTAPGSLAALISYLSLLQDHTNHGAWSISTHDLNQYMRLDASALRALNLVDNGTVSALLCARFFVFIKGNIGVWDEEHYTSRPLKPMQNCPRYSNAFRMAQTAPGQPSRNM